MIDRIHALEAIARRLEPDAARRAVMRDAAVNYGEDFLEGIGERAAYNADRERSQGLLGSPFSEEPAQMDDLLTLLRETVTEPGLNPASGAEKMTYH